jgi:hypothetical protein
MDYKFLYNPSKFSWNFWEIQFSSSILKIKFSWFWQEDRVAPS